MQCCVRLRRPRIGIGAVSRPIAFDEGRIARSGGNVRPPIEGDCTFGSFASGGGFGTTNSLPLEFGLGAAEEVSRIEVRWPSGKTTLLENPEVDRTVTIREDEVW